MPATDEQLLYGLGPFGGMKQYPGVYAPVRPFTDGPTPGFFIENVDVIRNRGAASPSYGRLNFLQFPSLGEITALSLMSITPNRPYWVAQDTTGRVNYFNANNAFLVDMGVLPNGVYSTGIQCDGNLYLNNGMFLYVKTDGVHLLQSQWQYPAPTFTPQLMKVPVGSGGLAQQTYYYAFTLEIEVPTNNGTIHMETAPIGATAPYPYHRLVTDNNTAIQISGIGGGTTPEGLVYKVRIYRQSDQQPVWFRLTTTSASDYIDSASDQSISGNAQIAFSGQQPPVGSGANWPIAEYLDRMWVFAVVQNASTQNQPQTQLWYSNVGQGWNFDNVAQVLLVGNQNTPTGIPNGIQQPPTYGALPVALVNFGSLLIAFRGGDAWFVTGQDQNTFQAVPLWPNLGCIAPLGPIVKRGIMAWPTDDGFWTWDGSTLNYIADDVWLYLQGIIPGTQSEAVGFYWQNWFCWSYPTSNRTLCWHAPTQQWATLPYATNVVAMAQSVGSNPNAEPSQASSPSFNQVVGVRMVGTTPLPSNLLDAWFADPVNDLGTPVQGHWVGEYSDAGVPHATKTIKWIVIEAPSQNAKVTVTLHRDFDQVYPLSEGVMTPWSHTFDLSQPLPFIVPVPDTNSQCTLFSLEATFQSSDGVTVPQIWKIEAYGKITREFAYKV